MLDLALNVLAAKRLTRLAVDDTIVEPIRQQIWKWSPPEKHGLGYVLTCHACASVWAGGVVISGLLPRRLRDTLALSEAVLIVMKLLDEQ